MNLKINPLSENSILQNYHFAAVCVGYESRARHAFEKRAIDAHSKAMFVFSEQRVLDFQRNFDFFKKHEFKETDATVNAIRAWVNDFGKLAIHDHLDTISVIVDISSMSRLLIGAICFEISELVRKTKFRVDVDFTYSIAKFGSVPDVFGPITANGPALPSLGGWARTPSAPCGLILGIGYEEDLALGTIEELEASEVWGFRPKDHEHGYDEAIDLRNKGLFDEISPGNLVRYSVFDPFTLFISLESLIALSKSDYRLIVVPFGPKIFALAGCLAVLCHYPEVGFWRVSGGANLQAVDREPRGEILGLTVSFLPPPSS